MPLAPTLILSPRYTDSSQILWRTANEKGWNVERINSFRPPADFTCEEPVIYGEPIFNQIMAEHLGIRLPSPPEDFLTKLPVELTGRSIRYMPAEQAREIGERVFIKPPNAKTFLAGVFETGAVLPANIEGHEMVLVQDVVDFVHEYRFFASPGIFAGSSYIVNKALAKTAWTWNDPPEVHAEAVRFFENDCYPTIRCMHPEQVEVAVIDIGFIHGIGWKVIELNEPNASGIYNCDPEKVLQILWMATRKT